MADLANIFDAPPGQDGVEAVFQIKKIRAGTEIPFSEGTAQTRGSVIYMNQPPEDGYSDEDVVALLNYVRDDLPMLGSDPKFLVTNYLQHRAPVRFGLLGRLKELGLGQIGRTLDGGKLIVIADNAATRFISNIAANAFGIPYVMVGSHEEALREICGLPIEG